MPSIRRGRHLVSHLYLHQVEWEYPLHLTCTPIPPIPRRDNHVNSDRKKASKKTRRPCPRSTQTASVIVFTLVHTCVQEASLLSRTPREAEMDRPLPQIPLKPASWTIRALRPLWASIKYSNSLDLSMLRSWVVFGFRESNKVPVEPKKTVKQWNAAPSYPLNPPERSSRSGSGQGSRGVPHVRSGWRT